MQSSFGEKASPNRSLGKGRIRFESSTVCDIQTDCCVDSDELWVPSLALPIDFHSLIHPKSPNNEQITPLSLNQSTAGNMASIWGLSLTSCIQNNLSTTNNMPTMDLSSSTSNSIFTFLKLNDSSPSLTGVQLLSQAAISSLINTSVFLFFGSSCLSTALVPFNITFQSQVLCTLRKLRILFNNF